MRKGQWWCKLTLAAAAGPTRRSGRPVSNPSRVHVIISRPFGPDDRLTCGLQAQRQPGHGHPSKEKSRRRGVARASVATKVHVPCSRDHSLRYVCSKRERPEMNPLAADLQSEPVAKPQMTQ